LFTASWSEDGLGKHSFVGGWNVHNLLTMMSASLEDIDDECSVVKAALCDDGDFSAKQVYISAEYYY